MWEIPDGSALSKVTKYRLEKNKTIVNIDLHEAISGPLNFKFLAIPVQHPFKLNSCSEKHYGRGDTEKSALRDCLNKIATLTPQKIFPKKK